MPRSLSVVLDTYLSLARAAALQFSGSGANASSLGWKDAFNTLSWPAPAGAPPSFGEFQLRFGFDTANALFTEGLIEIQDTPMASNLIQKSSTAEMVAEFNGVVALVSVARRNCTNVGNQIQASTLVQFVDQRLINRVAFLSTLGVTPAEWNNNHDLPLDAFCHDFIAP